MLLAVDTSTRTVGIALYDGYQILCEESWVSTHYHTVELAKAVHTNLTRADLSVADLDVLGIAIGPGSFTGLRIGLSLIKGIAFTHQLPVIGIPTLDITAQAIPVQDTQLIAVLQAGRTRLAVCWYKGIENKWESEGPVENLSPDELIKEVTQTCILTGEISPELRQKITENDLILPASPINAMRSPKYLAELAWQRWQNNSIEDILELTPLYLHGGDPIPG